MLQVFSLPSSITKPASAASALPSGPVLSKKKDKKAKKVAREGGDGADMAGVASAAAPSAVAAAAAVQPSTTAVSEAVRTVAKASTAAVVAEIDDLFGSVAERKREKAQADERRKDEEEVPASHLIFPEPAYLHRSVGRNSVPHALPVFAARAQTERRTQEADAGVGKGATCRQWLRYRRRPQAAYVVHIASGACIFSAAV